MFSAAKKGKKKKKKAEPSVAMLDEHGELKMAGMLQTAETNHATMNLGEAVHETGLFEPDDVLMVISHHYARRHQDEIDAAPWKDYLLVEHLRRILQREEEKLDEKEKDAISDYIEKATSRDAIRVDQSKALTILLQYSRPRIVICTLGIARRIAGKIAPMTKYLVIDEIGQVSEVGFLCLLSALPFVRSVLLAGDHRQLGLYDVEIPKHVRAYGYTSLVEVVTEKRPPKACTKLRKVYRSHPEVVEKVIKPLYDNEVECGIDASARTLLEKIPFASKEFGHVLVIDAKRGQATDKENKSWTNDHHTEITVRFVQSVRKAVPEASVRVLCYYSQQEHEITNELRETAPDVQVHTITSYQGRQADVTVLVTTRTGYDQDPAPEFVLDPQRTTVGLSRLKELLVVVGDVQLLQRGETWRRVLGNLRGNHVLRPSQLKVLLAPIEGEDARPYDHDAEEEEERLGAYAGNAPLVSASASNAPAEEMLANPTTYSAPSALHTSGAQTDAERGATSDE
ncbi:Mov10Moloney leukemia virus 10 [Aphelenchoides avenae]|nr:Mov10Moloney leukemia virus 10 [Aphelenchus avenae]